MLSREEYIKLSLQLDLFFLRIMKEHSFFLEAAFTAKNPDLEHTAAYYKVHFEQLLEETVILSSGVIDKEELATGQFVTPFTAEAERMSQFYTAIPINMRITSLEEALASSNFTAEPELENAVDMLNRKAITAVTALIGFKTKLRDDVASCRLFMNTYWLLIDHILREAKHFLNLLMTLQSRSALYASGTAALIQEEVFWNRIMAEHSKFIRGLLDPVEVALFNTADQFGKQFDALTAEAQKAETQPELLPKVTSDSMAATEKIRDFNAAGTGGLNECKIKAIILPLLGDHVLRESNHFLNILKKEKVL